MNRTGAAATFVASLVLVVVSLGAWATAPQGAVGADIPRTTSAEGQGLGQPGAPSIADTPAAGSGAPRPAGRPDRSGALPPADAVPRTDATRIEAPEQVDPPRRVSIAAVGIDMPIVGTGVRRDGQMELPDDPREIGWYRFGALPGDDRGSAVLGGHVDSQRYGVGPLANLAGVERGDRIVVTGPDGQRLRYRVTAVERISKAALPTDRLFDPDVAHRLVVVTCGGRYLPEAGGYEDNIVVIARPIG
jgi:hypothetical protein